MVYTSKDQYHGATLSDSHTAEVVEFSGRTSANRFAGCTTSRSRFRLAFRSGVQNGSSGSSTVSSCTTSCSTSNRYAPYSVSAVGDSAFSFHTWPRRATTYCPRLSSVRLQQVSIPGHVTHPRP